MREEKIVEVNKWLWEWCRRELLGFFYHGLWFQHGGFLARDGLYLVAAGRNIWTRKFTNVIRRELNCVGKGGNIFESSSFYSEGDSNPVLTVRSE